jgi:Arc/MetJ-type ribon-helix-helix transcriptional regulator
MKDDEMVSLRLSKALLASITEAIQFNFYKSRSDFLRSSVINEIQRITPTLKAQKSLLSTIKELKSIKHKKGDK